MFFSGTLAFTIAVDNALTRTKYFKDLKVFHISRTLTNTKEFSGFQLSWFPISLAISLRIYESGFVITNFESYIYLLKELVDKV